MAALNEYNDPNNQVLKIVEEEPISLQEAHELLQGKVRLPLVRLDLEE
jgi:hypothetical protein